MGLLALLAQACSLKKIENKQKNAKQSSNFKFFCGQCDIRTKGHILKKLYILGKIFYLQPHQQVKQISNLKAIELSLQFYHN